MKELLKGLLVGIILYSAIFLSLFGLAKYAQWQTKRDSSRQIAYQETSKYISADGGYYTRTEIITSVHGNGDTITTKSLRFIPFKNNTFFADSTGFEEITAWDSQNDGKWDEVFLCSYPTHDYGCNSIVLDNKNWQNWKYNACGCDKDKTRPFTNSTVMHVIILLKQYTD